MSHSQLRAPSLEPWLADGDALATLTAADPALRTRLGYLLSQVAARGIDAHTADMQTIQFEGEVNLAAAFLVLDKNTIDPENVRSNARRALVGKALACVLHGDPATLMLLPPISRAMPIGNAVIISHELEHITEKEDGILVHDEATDQETRINTGLRERRAYGLNAAAFRAADGSDFDTYIGGWPFDLSSRTIGYATAANLSFHDDDRYAPPPETMMRAMWDEGTKSRQLMTSIGRMSALENLTGYLPEPIRNELAAGFNDLQAS